MSIPINSIYNFSNRNVLVTGASGLIGQGIALRFAEAGANIVIHYHKQAQRAKSVEERIMKLGQESLIIQADVGSADDVEQLFQQAMNELGVIDVLINNAGIYPVDTLIDMTPEHWDAVIDSNLRSVYLCSQAAAKALVESKREGSFINIASIEAMNPAYGHTHYNAGKAGVLMFTRSSANELGQYGIRVNAVSPGLIWREGLDQAWPEGVSRYKQAVPLGRLGSPQDVADACLFLASPAAKWITGANLVVDGGVLTSTVY